MKHKATALKGNMTKKTMEVPSETTQFNMIMNPLNTIATHKAKQAPSVLQERVRTRRRWSFVTVEMLFGGTNNGAIARKQAGVVGESSSS